MGAPIQIRAWKSSAEGELFQQLPPEFGEGVVARAEDQDAVARFCFIKDRRAARRAGRRAGRLAVSEGCQ